MEVVYACFGRFIRNISLSSVICLTELHSFVGHSFRGKITCRTCYAPIIVNKGTLLSNSENNVAASHSVSTLCWAHSFVVICSALWVMFVLYVFWGHRSFIDLIAELVCVKCTSKAPWVIKIGNPSSRENLVMTSVYDQASAIHTDSGGGGGASRGKPHRRSKECHLSAEFTRKKLIRICFVNTRLGTLT